MEFDFNLSLCESKNEIIWSENEIMPSKINEEKDRTKIDIKTNLVFEYANLEPLNGMEFNSHEEEYSFYTKYAKKVGFGVPKIASLYSKVSR